jgi:hypothetical protein
LLARLLNCLGSSYAVVIIWALRCPGVSVGARRRCRCRLAVYGFIGGLVLALLKRDVRDQYATGARPSPVFGCWLVGGCWVCFGWLYFRSCVARLVVVLLSSFLLCSKKGLFLAWAPDLSCWFRVDTVVLYGTVPPYDMAF